MPKQYIEHPCDFSKKPTQKIDTANTIEITLGDMHANAMKFIFILVEEGIFDISTENYQKLFNQYIKCQLCFIRKQNTPLQKAIKVFKETLNELILLNRNIVIRLIGDLLADRGCCDFFILLILNQLRRYDIRVRIILSNHDGFFISAEEDDTFIFRIYQADDKGQLNSFKNLYYLLDQNIIQKQEIELLSEQAYRPYLCLIDSTLDKSTNCVNIFSHAPIGLDEIKQLAIQINTPFHDKTALSCHQSIQTMNAIFQNQYVKRGTISSLYNHQQVSNTIPPSPTPTQSETQKSTQSAAFICMWNRTLQCLNRPSTHHHYRLTFTHGHDDTEKTHGHIVNLDNQLGKHPAFFSGTYSVLRTVDPILSKQNEPPEPLSELITDHFTLLSSTSLFYIGLLVVTAGGIYLSSQAGLFSQSSQLSIDADAKEILYTSSKK